MARHQRSCKNNPGVSKATKSTGEGGGHRQRSKNTNQRLSPIIRMIPKFHHRQFRRRQRTREVSPNNVNDWHFSLRGSPSFLLADTGNSWRTNYPRRYCPINTQESRGILVLWRLQSTFSSAWELKLWVAINTSQNPRLSEGSLSFATVLIIMGLSAMNSHPLCSLHILLEEI